MKHESLFVSKPVLKLKRVTRERLRGRDAEVRKSGRSVRTTPDSQRAKRFRQHVCVDRGSPMNDVQEHASRKAPEGAPNVLCIIIDDVGFGSTDAFGGLVETPNLTRLARAGLRYVNHHGPASPADTTACLLTGRNQHWLRMGVAEASLFHPGNDRSRRANEAALRDTLHEHGYASMCLDGDVHRTTSRGPGNGLTEDLVDRAATFAWHRRSEDPDRPWLCYLRFCARAEAHRIGREHRQRYAGVFDGGWDYYRSVVLERQKKMGLVAEHAELAAALEKGRRWESLSAQEKRRFARAAELQAASLSHTDAQIGRLLDFLRVTGQLDDTLVIVLLGPAGGGAEPALGDGPAHAARYDGLPPEWTIACNTPFKLYEHEGRLGATRCPLIVHWPNGIRSKGEIRTQFHHVVDVLPTILSAIGVDPATELDERRRAPIDGVAMNYTFDDASTPSRHDTQHFEMLGNRAIVNGRWKAVAYRPRTSPGSQSNIRFDEDHWELYDLDDDPSECRDLLAAEDVRDVGHPMAQRLIELVGLWWAEARRYAILPLDVRLAAGALAREGYADDPYEDSASSASPSPSPSLSDRQEIDRLDRSWVIVAQLVVPPGGASGPIVAMSDERDGWSLYLNDGAPTFCCRLASSGITLIRSPEKLGPGLHVVRYEFEKRGPERRASGVGRLVVDGRKVVEVPLACSLAFDGSMDQSFEIGCDKGAPITDEYAPHASFTGKIIQVEMDLHPDFTADAERAGDARVRATLLLQ